VLELFPFDAVTFIGGGLVSLVTLIATTILLVYDLERPERFLRIVFRPQHKSWLTRGAFVLIAFSTVVGLWWVLELVAFLEWWPEVPIVMFRTAAMWIGIPLALGTAIYTAFLFGQAEGRDLWQSGLLPIHLIVQAAMMGSAAMLILNAILPVPEAVAGLAKSTFLVSVATDLIVTLLGEFGMPHASESAARAAHMISHGSHARSFWIVSIVLGHVGAFALALPEGVVLPAIGAVLCVIGLYVYEHAFVMAPQHVPNS
jgi:formate-dependent nitrite reductase membrane component NrfD